MGKKIERNPLEKEKSILKCATLVYQRSNMMRVDKETKRYQTRTEDSL